MTFMLKTENAHVVPMLHSSTMMFNVEREWVGLIVGGDIYENKMANINFNKMSFLFR